MFNKVLNNLTYMFAGIFLFNDFYVVFGNVSTTKLETIQMFSMVSLLGLCTCAVAHAITWVTRDY